MKTNRILFDKNYDAILIVFLSIICNLVFLLTMPVVYSDALILVVYSMVMC